MFVKKKTLAIALLPGDVSVIQTTTQKKIDGSIGDAKVLHGSLARQCVYYVEVHPKLFLKREGQSKKEKKKVARNFSALYREIYYIIYIKYVSRRFFKLLST
jgi:hypothetical protein